MSHKYLEEIGITDTPDTWGTPDDLREEKWELQRKTFGFDERETWDLDYTFCLWLYEHLKMYFDRASLVIDLDGHKFEYNETLYSQKELINILLDLLKFRLSKDFDRFDMHHAVKVEEIGKIWSIILPTMWW